MDGVKISPLRFTSKILFNDWKLGTEEEELTVMKVIVSGDRNGTKERVEYDMLDRYDPESRISSMSRTTGYTCTAAVHLIAKSMFSDHGVFPPELVGKDAACFDFVLAYLRERGIVWHKKISFS